MGVAHNGRGALKDREGELCRKIVDQSRSDSLQGLFVVNTDGDVVENLLEFDPKQNYPLPNLFVSMLQRLGIGAEKFASGTGTMRGLEMV